MAKALLKEPVDRKQFACLGLGLLGGALASPSYSIGVMGIAAGCLQGLTAVISKHYTTSARGDYFQSIGITMLVAGFFISLISDLPISQVFHAINLKLLTASIVALCATQYLYLLLYAINNTVSASAYSLMRLPWSMFFELLMFKTIPTPATLIGTSLVVVGGLTSRILDGRWRKLKH